ncbi:hypothetical protein PC128_g5050 [Phytophthora cactorum]|nr:hypothetical protein PC128_g5050 [Phytophthora cactorum]
MIWKVRLAGSEIDGFHTRIWDQERELVDAAAANTISEESLRRLQEELRLTQEEVITNAYVGSIHGGSTRGSTCGGSPPANQDSAPPDQDSRDLSQARSEVARESIARLTTERDKAQHDCSNVTAERHRLQLRISDLEVERDNMIAEWGVATRKQTELESSIRDLSDKLKTAQDAADTLNRQVSEIQGRHDRLAADHDRTFRQRDEALRWLAAVAETASRPIRVPGARSISVTSAGASGGGSGSTAAASGSLNQASSGSVIPAAGPPDHGSGSSAFTSAPAPASKSASPGPRSSGGGAVKASSKQFHLFGYGIVSDPEAATCAPQPMLAKALKLGSGNRGSTGKTLARPKGKQPIPRGFGFSSSDKDNEGDECDGDLEDSEEAEIADELLEEDTRRTLSQSRSEGRRRSHATPSRHSIGGSGGPTGGSGDSDDDDFGAGPSESGAGPAGPAGSGSPAGGSGSHPSGSPGSVSGRAGSASPGVNPSGSPGSGARSTAPSSSGGAQGSSTSRSAIAVSKSTPAPDLLPENPFGPDNDFIPGRLQPRQLDATAIAPWAAENLNQVTIVAMKIGILFPDIPLKTG